MFSVLIYSYINTSGNWKNLKLCENTPPCGRRVSTQFLVFPISTRVDITVYQHEKCFIFLKYCGIDLRFFSSVFSLDSAHPSFQCLGRSLNIFSEFGSIQLPPSLVRQFLLKSWAIFLFRVCFISIPNIFFSFITCSVHKNPL